LATNRGVRLQVADAVFAAKAHSPEGAERARLWHLAARQWPDYDVYQTKTDREIPVVVLERAA
jgi:deazaflavin-dependent oxidoreductase (nitroreductase family)